MKTPLGTLKMIKNAFTRSVTLKSGIWYSASTLFLKGSAFLTIPIFTRLLTVEDYGVVAVYMSFAGIMSILSGMDLHAGIGRALFDFQENYHAFLSSVLALSSLSFLAVLVFVNLFSYKLAVLFDLEKELLLFAVIAGYGSFVLTFYNTHLLFTQQYRLCSVLSIAKTLAEIFLSIFIILLLTKERFYGRIYSSLIITFIVIALVCFLILRENRTILFPKAWWYALKIGIPLIPHNLSHIMLVQFDRMAIKALIGTVETGLYSFAYNLGMIPLLFLGAANSAWVPWFYRKMHAGSYEEIQKVTKVFTVFFLALTICIMMLAPEMAILLAPKNYLSSVRILPVVVLSYFFQFLYTIYVNYAFYLKKTFAISLGTMMAGVINIFLNLRMIPIWGYEIAAWTTVFSYFALFLFHWFNVAILIKVKTIPLKGMIITATIASALALQQYATMFFAEPFSLTERLLRLSISTMVILLLLVFVSKDFFTLINKSEVESKL